MEIKQALALVEGKVSGGQAFWSDGDTAKNLANLLRAAADEIERLQTIVRRCNVGAQRVLDADHTLDALEVVSTFCAALRATVDITREDA